MKGRKQAALGFRVAFYCSERQANEHELVHTPLPRTRCRSDGTFPFGDSVSIPSAESAPADCWGPVEVACCCLTWCSQKSRFLHVNGRQN